MTGVSKNNLYEKTHNLSDFLIYLSGFVCLITLFSNFQISSWINRTLLGLYMVVALLLLMHKISKSSALFLGLTLALVILDLVFTELPFVNLNTLFYFPLWVINLVVFYEYFGQMKKSIDNCLGFLIIISILWNIITFISFFLNSSYVIRYDRKLFVSFCGTEHRFAATALFVAVVTFMYYRKSKNFLYLFLMIIPFVSIVLTNTRTYIIVLFLFALFVVMTFFRKVHLKRTVFLLGAVGIVFVGVYLTQSKLSQTNAEYSIKARGVLNYITSGRSDFWEIDIVHFYESPFINRLLGSGYNFIYDVNREFYGAEIWAHNDYINILLSHGYIGLLFYFYAFFLLLKVIFAKYKVRFTYFILYVLIILFNAMFNMVYTYTIANLLTPVFAVLMLTADNREKKEVIKD